MTWGDRADAAGWSPFDDRSYGEPQGICHFCDEPIQPDTAWGKNQPEGPLAHGECVEEEFSREGNPMMAECWRGAALCPRCARAEAEGQAVIDRTGTLHSPEAMRMADGRRNPSLLLLGNPPTGLPRVPRNWFRKMVRQVGGSDPAAVVGDIWYHKLSPAKRAEILRREGRTRAEPLAPKQRAYARSNPSLLLLGNPGNMLLRKEDRRNLPALYSQEDNPDPTVWVKFFTPWTSWTWYATEFDGNDRFFGLVDGHEMELGYFSLSELESLRGPGGLRIERDIHWRPTPLSKVKSREVNPLPPRKRFALHHGERGKFCPHNLAYYSGQIPMTGKILCRMCGTHLPDDFFKKRRGNPSAPAHIKRSWEKFHQREFQGKCKTISDIPGVPVDLMELGAFVDLVMDSGWRWRGDADDKLCYEPSDKSLWVVGTAGPLQLGGLDRGEVATIAYRTYGKSGKDHAVYEHRFHRPLPTLEVVHQRAVLLQGGRYAVTDWIRR